MVAPKVKVFHIFQLSEPDAKSQGQPTSVINKNKIVHNRRIG